MNDNPLPTIPADRMDDLHGLEIAETADLVLFMAGNQFMVMPEIVSAFQRQYPEIKLSIISACYKELRILKTPENS